jgi:hypothetical protein
MDVSFTSSCGAGHGHLDRDFLEQVGERPGDASHYTVSPSIDTLGKVKNDRWASAGLSKIAHMHESRVAARSKLDFTSNLLSGGVFSKSSMADEFSEARQHCNVVPEGPSIPEKITIFIWHTRKLHRGPGACSDSPESMQPRCLLLRLRVGMQPLR